MPEVYWVPSNDVTFKHRPRWPPHVPMTSQRCSAYKSETQFSSRVLLKRKNVMYILCAVAVQPRRCHRSVACAGMESPRSCSTFPGLIVKHRTECYDACACCTPFRRFSVSGRCHDGHDDVCLQWHTCSGTFCAGGCYDRSSRNGVRPSGCLGLLGVGYSLYECPTHAEACDGGVCRCGRMHACRHRPIEGPDMHAPACASFSGAMHENTGTIARPCVGAVSLHQFSGWG